MATIQTWLKKNKTIPYRDREWILQYVLKKSRSDIYLSLEKTLNQKQIHQCSDIVHLYQKGLPLAYILEKTEFYGYEFQIKKGVLIPRAETETLVSQALKYCPNKQAFYVIDIGCGSGCIGLSILLKNKQAQLIAIDQSQKALRLTQKNATLMGLKNRVKCIHGDIQTMNTKPLPKKGVVVANPPYLSFKDPKIQPSVMEYEPHSALFSGHTGLEAIQVWLEKVTGWLKQGHYFFEIGYNQHWKVKKILKNHSHFSSIRFYSDLSGIKRVVHCTIQPKT